MVKVLTAIVARLRQAWLFEAAGTAAIVWGLYEIHGAASAAIGVGVAALVKSAELDAGEDST